MFRRAAALACLIAVCGASSLTLAQGSQKDLEEKRTKKLAGEWLKKAEWFTDYDKARAKAAETDRLIFGYFTRSYSP